MKHRKRQPRLPLLRNPTSLQRSPQDSFPSRPYFEKSMQIINEKDCYQDGKLNIDGGFGDYRMSIFRVKDRRKRQRQPTTVLTPNFMHSCEQVMPQNLTEQFHRIMGKPNQLYLSQEIENPQTVEPQKPTNVPLPKWESEIDEHLSHRYASDHQIQKWFSSCQIPTKSQNAKKSVTIKQDSVLSSVRSPLNVKKNRGRSTQAMFMFRYMDRKKAETQSKPKQSLYIKFTARVNRNLQYS